MTGGRNRGYISKGLKENEYYLIGDNREDSLDSRYFGPVSLDDISGVVDFRIYPFTKFGKIN